MPSPPPGVFGICVMVKDLLLMRRVSVRNKGDVRKRMSAQEQADGERQ